MFLKNKERGRLERAGLGDRKKWERERQKKTREER